MNIAYKNRIASPYQAKKPPFDFSARNHPVRLEIERHVGEYGLVATIKEDAETKNLLRHVSGLVAFVCTITHNGKTIGVGRSNVVINEKSKYFDRIISSAWGYSLIDAISKMTRTIDNLRNDPVQQTRETNAMFDEAYEARQTSEEMITDRQKAFLSELIHTKVDSEAERSRLESEIDEYSKADASKLIQRFQG